MQYFFPCVYISVLCSGFLKQKVHTNVFSSVMRYFDVQNIYNFLPGASFVYFFLLQRKCEDLCSVIVLQFVM